jgi:hypothetical protein
MPKYKITIVDVKRKPFLLICYSLNEVWYKFYDPVMKKIIISCNVEFIEDQWLKDIDM